MATEIDLTLSPYGVNPQTQKTNQANPTQQKVLDWVDNVRAGKYDKAGIPVLYLQGGIGSGKTRALLAPVIEMLLEIPGLRTLWGRQDFNDLRTSAMETFFEVMPPELIISKNVQEHRYIIGQNQGNKSQIFFRELKDLSGLGSQEFGLIVITEVSEISKRAYDTVKERLRQANMPTMLLMEGNPPNEEHWLHDITNPKHKDYEPNVEMWMVSTYENWQNLPLAYRNSLEARPESWKKKGLYGGFGFTPDGKPFYDGFVEKLHKRKLIYNPGKPLIRAWDYGWHHPFCSIHQIDAKGRWLILREIMGSGITIEKFGNFAKLRCKEWFPDADWSDYGDPAGEQVSDKSEKTSVEILASLGIFVTSKSSTYRERKEIIERRLATLIDGLPALLVDENCQTIIDGFLGGYHYPERKRGQAFNPIIFERPFKDGYYEHGMNSVEYFAVNMFTGAESTEDKGEMVVKIVGDMKDVHIEYEESTTARSRYQRQSVGVFSDDE